LVKSGGSGALKLVSFEVSTLVGDHMKSQRNSETRPSYKEESSLLSASG
jgi:hypothetical protein